MGTKRQFFYSHEIEGDGGLEFPEPTDMTSEIILGQDVKSADQVLALGHSINNLYECKENLDDGSSSPSQEAPFKEMTMPFVPAEPPAASLIEEVPYHCYGTKVDPYDEFADGCRIFVWRNSQWHPVSATVLEQIQTNLSDGKRIFKVLDGVYSWKIDASRKNEWFQVSPAGTKRPLRCTPTILIEEDASINFTEQVEAEWQDMCSSSDIAVTVDNFHEAHRKKCGDNKDEELLFHSIEHFHRRMNFSPHTPLTLCKWMHFRLLELQAPSIHAIHQLNKRLDAWLSKQAKILDIFMKVFLDVCEDQVSMRLTIPQMQSAVRAWSGEASNETFAPNYIQHLNSLLAGDLLEEGEPITYFEFLNYMTGLTWCDVELYFYDLTKGSGWWWTPLLLGQSMPKVWHCGIVVLDKEYRYGGNIFESTPGCTAFGEPQKIEKLGTTCRTRQDILSFINRHLSHNFSVDNYQVLSNNSNHFCDALSMFLTNKHISAEVLAQPKLIMTSTVAKSLSKWLPWLKGTPPKQSKTILRAKSEWEMIQADSFVTYEYEDGWTIIARVIQKKEHSCDLRWYNRQDNQFYVRQGVSKQAVQPLFGLGDPLRNQSLPQRKL